MLYLENDFIEYLKNEGKSLNTISSYTLNIKEYLKWFDDTFGIRFNKLHRQNIMEYRAYLINVKRYKGKNLSGKTINSKLSSLMALNKFLIEKNIQEDIVITKKDTIKIQQSVANPCLIDKKDVEKFRQEILEAGDKRLYALATLMAYSGLRISEALNLKTNDLCFEAKEAIVRNGKGGKERVIYINSKVVQALREYLKHSEKESEYVFVSRENDVLDRTVVNRHFKKYSNKITPHQLRHFFCSNAIENGFSIPEVANLAGHKSVQTSLIYTNPSIKSMKNKMELL